MIKECIDAIKFLGLEPELFNFGGKMCLATCYGAKDTFVAFARKLTEADSYQHNGYISPMDNDAVSQFMKLVGFEGRVFLHVKTQTIIFPDIYLVTI